MPSIELRYSEALVREAVVEFYKRTIGLSLPIVFGLVLLFIVCLLCTSNAGWITGVVSAALMFALDTMTALYVVHFRNSMQRFQAMRSPTTYLDLNIDSLTIKANTGSSEILSESISEVWEYDDFWLVFSFSQPVLHHSAGRYCGTSANDHSVEIQRLGVEDQVIANGSFRR